MESAPCGCEQAAKGLRITEPAARSAALQQAQQRAEAWGCKRAGCRPKPRGELERSAADRVAELTGHRCEGCPLEVAYREDVVRVSQFRASKLSPLAEPDPPAIFFEALREMDHAEGELLEMIRSKPAPTPTELMPGPISNPTQLPRRPPRYQP